MNTIITDIIILAPPILLALTLHEFSHGIVADKLGDPTPRNSGRLTLNPLKHLDPLGTIAFFLIHFGWAKPVMVNPSNFNSPKRDGALVALAGPASNLFLAIVSAFLIKLLPTIASFLNYPFFLEKILSPVFLMLAASVWINLVLCVLNLLPVPPLDGGRIVTGILPESLSRPYQKLERYGILIILALALTGMLSKIIRPIISYANNLLLFS